MPRHLIGVKLCLLAFLAVPAGQTSSGALVLSNVTIVDGTGALPRPGMTLVVVGDRIADLFSDGEREVPADARRLDVGGTFVIPGLIDTHVHLATTTRPAALVEALLRATLLGGVTTVRDMGGNGSVVGDLQQAAGLQGAASPAIHPAAVFAGPDSFWFTDPTRAGYLNGGQAPGTAPWLVRVDARTDIRGAVERAKAWGAAGIKLHSDLSNRQVREIAGEARRQGLPLWSRTMVGPASPREIIDARVTSISHAEDVVWQGATGVPAALMGRPVAMPQAMIVVPAGSRTIQDLLNRMKDRAVMLEPTLFAGVEAAALSGDDRLQRDMQTAYAVEITRAARELKVPIIAGTDAIGGSSPNLHVELQLLVERAGLTPLQAIRAATFDAARAIGIADQVGSIVVGRQADLVVLDGNPADDIRNTQTISVVIRGGVVHERTEPMPVPPLAEPPTPSSRRAG